MDGSQGVFGSINTREKKRKTRVLVYIVVVEKEKCEVYIRKRTENVLTKYLKDKETQTLMRSEG